ncbi:MAG: iron ABC transporter substrate-binding protein, partial [Paramuribaculum sp.]|nr:iron ABC transporter substrate-binding protein [Paramuribaculum sp.]
YDMAARADVWLNTGTLRSLGEVRSLCPKMTDVECLRSGMVYNHTLRSTAGGGNDFFESAVVRPDLVLRDLVKIFHPEMVDSAFVYYQQLQ